MGQRKNHVVWLFFGVMLLLLASLAYEGRRQGSNRSSAKSPRVASLVPAATDLLIGMGAGDHLVAVSNYDVERGESRGLPRVGDYQSFDWEQIHAAKPDVMIVFMAPDRMPPGLRQRAEQLKMSLLNVRTERLADIYDAMDKLGEAVGENPKAQAAKAKLQSQLDAVRARVGGRAKVRTLIVREKTGDGVVGRGTFISDILEIAGGENVIEAEGWRNIDREMLSSLQPDVILELLPEAAPQVIEEAKRFWEGLPQVPAVANKRIYIFTEWYSQQPGSHVGELAERFSQVLHGQPSTAAAHGPGDGQVNKAGLSE
jgi:iron complex transport system substrate-binding protein